MAGTIAYIGGATGVGSITDVSATNPLPVTSTIASGQSVTLAAGTASIGTLAGDSYAHITTSTTTTVKNAAGTLKSVSVNTKGTVASTTTLKDGTTVLAIIDSLNLSGTWTFNIACATSIVCVTTGTVAPDVTVTYQ